MYGDVESRKVIFLVGQEIRRGVDFVCPVRGPGGRTRFAFQRAVHQVSQCKNSWCIREESIKWVRTDLRDHVMAWFSLVTGRVSSLDDGFPYVRTNLG